MPETPYFLVFRGKERAASKALHWLRGKGYDITPELDKTKEGVAQQKALNTVNFKTLFTVGMYWKPLTICLCLMFFQQFSGINAVSFNIQLIFEEANTGISACKQNLFLSRPRTL